jgi:hypothetical protein
VFFPPPEPVPLEAVGVTAFDGADGDPVPATLEAVTANVWAVPPARAITVRGPPEPVTVRPPGIAVTVYEFTAAKPPCAGGPNETVAVPSPATALTVVGAVGASDGKIANPACAKANRSPGRHSLRTHEAARGRAHVAEVAAEIRRRGGNRHR